MAAPQLLLLLSLAPAAVAAFDGGDASALLLGVAVTVAGLCACLGWYAYRAAPAEPSSSELQPLPRSHLFIALFFLPFGTAYANLCSAE
uniref:Uncharacterized protein n=1 Tax=Denticeps clupeoides TaxID=299321 RepID=A0AAY4ETU4_9TELE